MRITAILIILLLCLPLGATAAAAEAPASPPGAASGAESPQSVHLSDAEALALAARLTSAGQLPAAKQIYALLLRSKREEIQLEAAFQLSLILIYEKNYKDAVSSLLAILNRHPNLARVRLELARAYFMDENYSDARFHFELVKGGKDIPPEVAANIDRFLDAIRRQKNWDFSLGFNILPDSNVNQASGQTEECIATNFGLLCRRLDEEKKTVGARLNMSGNHYLRLGKNIGIRSSLGLYFTEFGNRDYDDYILNLASGPRYIFGGGELSLQPTYMKRWIAGKKYNSGYGGQLSWQKDIERLILAGSVAYTHNVYDDEYVDGFLRGNNYRVSALSRYILSNRSFVQLRAAYERDLARERSYGSDNYTLGLGAYYFFQYGFSLYSEFSVTKTRYRDERWFITEDSLFDNTVRDDLNYNVYAQLSTNVFEAKGLAFVPSLQYYYSRRDSNIWSYDYDRHRVNLGVEFKF